MILRKKLILDVGGPVLSRSDLIGGFGVDSPVARTSDGNPYLPGSLVVGRLAEAYRRLGRAQQEVGRDAPFLRDLADLFAAGNKPEEDGDENEGRARRRRIFVSDLVCFLSKPVEDTRTRIAIDPVTESVQTGMLQVIEIAHDVGEKATFIGEIRVVAPASEHAAIEARLEKALRWVSQWGALRSVGYGVAVDARLEDADKLPANAEAPVIEFVLTARDLLCVGERRVAANVYESGATIPGGAIKGAMANLIASGCGRRTGGELTAIADQLPSGLQALARNFDQLRVLHAIPNSCANRGRRTRRPPHSIVAIERNGQDILYDLALAPDPSAPCLIGQRAPVYEPDYKDTLRKKVKALTGWSEPMRELRVRTQIDPVLKSAAANGLFAVSYCRHDTHEWRGAFDLSRIDPVDHGAVLEGIREALTEGLPGLGRGGAFCSIELIDAPAQDPVDAVFHHDGRLILVLQTPALLRRPRPMSSGDVTADYASAFAELDGAGLSLNAAFVRERLAGANFMAQRLPTSIGYRPFLLTEPGSTFVFKSTDPEQATVTARRWLTEGLKPPQATLEFYGMQESDADLWRYLPFLPENGYGEVWARGPVLDGEHWAEAPTTASWTAIPEIMEPAE